MASIYKVIAICVFVIISVLGTLTDASGLGEILAAGLITLLLKDGPKHHFGGYHLGHGRYGHQNGHLYGHPNGYRYGHHNGHHYGHRFGHHFHLGGLSHIYPFYPIHGFGHGLKSFEFAPNIGGLRYKPGCSKYNYPSEWHNLITGFHHHEMNPYIGLKAPVHISRDIKHGIAYNAFDVVKHIIQLERENNSPFHIEALQNAAELTDNEHLQIPALINLEQSGEKYGVTNSELDSEHLLIPTSANLEESGEKYGVTNSEFDSEHLLIPTLKSLEESGEKYGATNSEFDSEHLLIPTLKNLEESGEKYGVTNSELYPEHIQIPTLRIREESGEKFGVTNSEFDGTTNHGQETLSSVGSKIEQSVAKPTSQPKE